MTSFKEFIAADETRIPAYDKLLTFVGGGRCEILLRVFCYTDDIFVLDKYTYMSVYIYSLNNLM